MEKTYLAHIREGDTQTVRDHLRRTAELAGGFGEAFHSHDQAYLAGLLHDIGKYSEAFQKRLEGGPKVDHSTAGAQEAIRMKQPEIAFVVAGHHSGIPDRGSKVDPAESSTLCGRLRRKLEPYGAWKQEISPSKAEAVSMDPLSQSFHTRMLFSCLTDGDYLDTEAFMTPDVHRTPGASMESLLKKLHTYISPWMTAENPLNQRRTEILRACLDAGRTAEKGMFTLTVPTGGGKTVSSLAFALEMAVAKKMDHVVYVIPYTSIIDQTAQVFSEILGPENVLEHHSGMDYDGSDGAVPMDIQKALAAENWDAPVIVTTAVQFFESLYSNRPSKCRKLHNLANSVLILDEAQTLPLPYLRPCAAALTQLTQHFESTVVLCTATQPALESVMTEWMPNPNIREICPEPQKQTAFFHRTTVEDVGKWTKEQLVSDLQQYPQCLCVVNRRKTAQDLYGKLEDAYCLTTLLCPIHRKAILAEIRERLRTGQPCRVVSTSLIEAGVDLDFPRAYREKAGLDSILQTAGRCNREGKRPASESLVSVFQLDGEPELSMLAQNLASVRNVFRKFEDPTSLEAIHSYFTFLRTLKGDKALDKQNILKLSQEFSFAAVAENFHLIDSPTRTVYIPLEGSETLLDSLRYGIPSRSLFRKLGPYGVSIYPNHVEALENQGLLEHIDGGNLILRDLHYYDPKTGLTLDLPEGQAWMI